MLERPPADRPCVLRFITVNVACTGLHANKRVPSGYRTTTRPPSSNRQESVQRESPELAQVGDCSLFGGMRLERFVQLGGSNSNFFGIIMQIGCRNFCY